MISFKFCFCNEKSNEAKLNICMNEEIFMFHFQHNGRKYYPNYDMMRYEKNVYACILKKW